MSSSASGLLLVHAHPDDESINNGVTMAAYARRGVPVTLVTCTQGEEGEVIPAELAQLAPDRGDALGPYRAGELAAAMAALGVTDHRFLGGPGRWRDSGMMGAPQNDRPGAFWAATVDEPAAALADVIREVRPAVLITYDPHGGYGHPDHIQAHRVAMRGAELAELPGPEGAPPHRVARVLWNCVPRPAAEAALARLAAAGPGPFAGVAALADVPGVTEPGRVAVEVAGTPEQGAAKRAALGAHATQVALVPDGGTDERRPPAFALSNGLVQPLWTTESYRLGAGQPYPPGATDLLSGLEAAR